MQQDRPCRCSWGPLGAIVMLFVWCAVGCFAPQYKEASAPGYGGSGGEYGYDDAERADKDGAYDYVEEERVAAKQAPSGTAMPVTPNAAPPDDPSGAKQPAPEPEPDSSISTPTHGRQIIYTAGMGLSVFEVDDVMNQLEAIPERHGGWVHERYNNRVVLRVPAAKLALIIEEITAWGVVEWKTLSALDVTAEYTDLDSRMRVLEQMQKHLQELLARAQNVEQALEIQVELARITAELEMLRARMRMLESSIAFSTLAVELLERNTTTAEPSHDPFPWVDELGAEATAYR